MVNGESIKNKLAGKEERPRLLLEIIAEHNESIKALIGKGYAKATWIKYCTTLKHIKSFLQWKYRVSEINIKDIRFDFIADFEFYLQSQKNIHTSTNAKYLKNIKKILKECVVKGWLSKDPFLGYKIKHQEAEIPHLSSYDLHALESKKFAVERLSVVKDLFLFSCYTGFAYIDVINLTHHHIEVGSDGKQWIVKKRQKTNIASRVPLLPPALAIIKKYQHHPKVSNSGKLLPVLSNQKVNAYLKEIGNLCGIKKEVSFHVARHTFATTITLGNGVPIDSVSKMLGHKKMQTTQIYAKVLDQKISADMQHLYERFSGNDHMP